MNEPLPPAYNEAMKQSAGTLLYRDTPAGRLVLLVHPSGPYNKNAPWGIPKGIPDDGEGLEQAARRETQEETGLTPGALTYLGHADYKKSRKRIHCFAGPAPDAAPGPLSWEIDQARFLSLDEARGLIHPDQAVFLDWLGTNT